LKNILIPVPPLEIQKKILLDVKSLEMAKTEHEEKIKEIDSNKSIKINSIWEK